MEQQVSELKQNIPNPPHTIARSKDAGGALESAIDPINDPRMIEVLKLTQEMFGGPVSIEVLADPAEPDDEFTVFTVQGQGSVADLVKKRLEWHERVRKLPNQVPGDVRLSIY